MPDITTMQQRLLLIELNEVSFRLVEGYVARGELPAFGRLISNHGVTQTTSEVRYEEVEPWIQWVTAHTGKSFAEHGVFRLGDIKNSEVEQLWEQLEAKGLNVGAFSPMNARNRLVRPAFFLPDPWTDTPTVATPFVQAAYGAISRAVNDNAEGRISVGDLLRLGAAVIRFASPRNYTRYAGLAVRGLRRPWCRAAFLDLFLVDLFSALMKRSQVDFASIFLNGAAHVQHHYMHSSTAAGSAVVNPEWYCAKHEDPVLEVYRVYDTCLADLRRRFPDYRLMIATGLHQVPHERAVFYWRLRDHADFLKRIAVPFAKASPRMSRDFLLQFDNTEQRDRAVARLGAVRDLAGKPLFELEVREREIFVTLSYPDDIPADFAIVVENERYEDVRKHLVFVAIKNGEHDPTGFFVDTYAEEAEAPFPLKELPNRITAVFNEAQRKRSAA